MIALHAIAVLVLAILCHGAGRAVLDVLRLQVAGAGLRAVVATGLGFGVIGQALFALGLAGVLTRWAVWILLAILALPAARYALELWTLARHTPPLVHVVLIAGSVLTFLRALYPPTGHDATMYHLPFARLFAESGSLGYADTLRFPIFPQLNEMLFTASLLVADDVTAQLTQWFCMVVTGAAIIAIARHVLPAAIWFSIPLVSWLGSQAYIDCGLAMSVTLAFAAWIASRSSDDPRWAFVIGAFAGMAAATKYHGLFFVALFGLALIRRFRHAALYVLGVIVVAAPWYIRIAAWTGNPLFPYFGSIFGENDWGLTLHASRYLGAEVLPESASFTTWLRHNVYNLKVWVVPLMPVAAAGAFVERRVRFLFLGAMAYAIAVWRLDARFLVAIVPLLAICSATAIQRLHRSVAAIFLAAALLLAIAVGVRDLRRLGPIPRTAAEREAFLAPRIHMYRALRHIERTAGPRTVYAYRGSTASYYWNGRLLGEWFGPYRYGYVMPLLGRPDDLAYRLRSFGAEYFILPRTVRFEPPPVFERVYADDTDVVWRLQSRQ